MMERLSCVVKSVMLWKFWIKNLAKTSKRVITSTAIYEIYRNKKKTAIIVIYLMGEKKKTLRCTRF